MMSFSEYLLKNYFNKDYDKNKDKDKEAKDLQNKNEVVTSKEEIKPLVK